MDADARSARNCRGACRAQSARIRDVDVARSNDEVTRVGDAPGAQQARGTPDGRTRAARGGRRAALTAQRMSGERSPCSKQLALADSLARAGVGHVRETRRLTEKQILDRPELKLRVAPCTDLDRRELHRLASTAGRSRSAQITAPPPPQRTPHQRDYRDRARAGSTPRRTTTASARPTAGSRGRTGLRTRVARRHAPRAGGSRRYPRKLEPAARGRWGDVVRETCAPGR